MEMNQEIKSIIEKNLPAHVGAVLQERLKKADADEKRLEEALKQIKDTCIENINLSTDNKLLKEREATLADVLIQTEELKELVRDRRVFEAETKLQCALSENANMVNFVGMVFKSPVYKNNISQWKSYSDEWNCDLQRNIKKVSSVDTTEERTEE
jgi:hypothetical protein